MSNLICKKCGLKFKGELIIKDDKVKHLKKTRCPRCKNDDITLFSRAIKLYFRCKNDHIFKISEVCSIHLMKEGERPVCSICGSTVSQPTQKLMYKKFAGTNKKQHKIEIKTLF